MMRSLLFYSVLRCLVAAANVIRTMQAACREPVPTTVLRKSLYSAACTSSAALANRFICCQRSVEGVGCRQIKQSK